MTPVATSVPGRRQPARPATAADTLTPSKRRVTEQERPSAGIRTLPLGAPAAFLIPWRIAEWPELQWHKG
jgi:hypothetical protein